MEREKTNPRIDKLPLSPQRLGVQRDLCGRVAVDVDLAERQHATTKTTWQEHPQPHAPAEWPARGAALENPLPINEGCSGIVTLIEGWVLWGRDEGGE